MKQNVWLHRCFILAFLVLTFFSWCPLFYGSYGPAQRILGIPSWAVWAFAVGALLFLLEWIYLFLSHRALSDEELPAILSDLEDTRADASAVEKEDD